jgi:hypothetical protein
MEMKKKIKLTFPDFGLDKRICFTYYLPEMKNMTGKKELTCLKN